MTESAEKIDHPHIVSRADYCGGSPVIKGTKFPVRSVVNYVLRQGISPEELVGRVLPSNPRASLRRAFSTITITKESVDQDLQENSQENHRPVTGV